MVVDKPNPDPIPIPNHKSYPNLKFGLSNPQVIDTLPGVVGGDFSQTCLTQTQQMHTLSCQGYFSE